MPYGFRNTQRKTFQDTQLIEARERLREHDDEQRALGHDPQWIGIHEVKPVVCRCCGEVIPWNVLRGYDR